jgi:hypothetical protein
VTGISSRQTIRSSGDAEALYCSTSASVGIWIGGAGLN